MYGSIFESEAARQEAIRKGKIVIGADGTEILTGGGRRSGRTVAQDKRDAKKKRNRARSK